MPSITAGFTGNEVVARVVQYIGNSSSTFQSFVQESVPLAIFRFCKMHDWSFLHKSGLSLQLSLGVAEYDLTVANIGFNMDASEVEIVRDETNNTVLRKIDLQQIRRFDADNNDGSATELPLAWAAVSNNRIRIWPPSVQAVVLKIDGKITPNVPLTTSMTAFLSDSASGSIPYKFQEGLIEYIIAIALDRENDDRAPGKMQAAQALIRADILADMASLGETDNPRIKSLQEANIDGLSTRLVPGFNYGD